MDGDLIGTVRREDHHGGCSIWVRLVPDATPGNEWTCVWSTSRGNIDGTLPHSDVASMPVIGAVPGTPAATAPPAAPATQPTSYYVEPQQLTPGGPIHGGFTVVETPGPPTGPDVVTLCGSMRFHAQILAVAAEETAAGHIVLAPFCVVAQYDQDGHHKAMLDRLHRDKIRMANRVIVVSDESGYYGESTTAEIAYAFELDLPTELRRVASPAAPADDEALKRLERKLDTLRAIAQGVSSGADDMRKEIDNVTRALAALREGRQ